MENQSSSPNLTVFVSKHRNLLKYSEIISVSIFVIGFILHLLEIKNTNNVLLLGSIITALTYFLYAFKINEYENLETTGILNSTGFINFIYKFTYLSFFTLSIAAAAIILKSNSDSTMLIVSGISLLFILIVSLFTKINDRSRIYNFYFYIRIVPAIILLIYLAIIQYKVL
jgi:hypothetical protein